MFINVSLIRLHPSSSLDIKPPAVYETIPIRQRGRGQERGHCRAEEVKRFVKGAKKMKAFITRIMLLLDLMAGVNCFAVQCTSVACQLVGCETTRDSHAATQNIIQY